MMYDDLPIKQKKKRDFPWRTVKLPKGKSSRLVFLIKIHIPSVEGQHQRLPEKREKKQSCFFQQCPIPGPGPAKTQQSLGVTWRCWWWIVINLRCRICPEIHSVECSGLLFEIRGSEKRTWDILKELWLTNIFWGTPHFNYIWYMLSIWKRGNSSQPCSAEALSPCFLLYKYYDISIFPWIISISSMPILFPAKRYVNIQFLCASPFFWDWISSFYVSMFHVFTFNSLVIHISDKVLPLVS